MSISDTQSAKKYASIAETASAQAKLYADYLNKAPDYASQAQQYALDAQAASEAAQSVSGGVVEAANSASASAISAADSANAAGDAAADAVVNYVERSVHVPDGESISELPASSARANTLPVFGPDGDVVVKPLSDFASLDSSGKVPISQIPSVALSDVFTVSSEEAMLNLDAEEGDIAIRTDISQTYVLMQTPASELNNWKQILNDALVQLQQDGDKKVSSSSGGTVYSDYAPSQFYRFGEFSAGGVLSSSSQVVKESSGLWWFYTGSFPKYFSSSTSPTSDPLWYCAGLLNGKEINNLSSWCDTVSNVDVTFEMQQYFRTLGHLGLKAYGSGVVTVSSRITIPNVEFDFSNLTITISPNSDSSVSGGGGKVLHLTDPDTVELSGQSFTTSNIGQMGTIQLSGPRYRNCTVGIEGEGSSNRAYYRGTFGTYTNAFDLYVMDDSGTGYHGDTPALFKYNGTAKHVVRPIRPQMIIRGPTFVLPSPLSESRSLRCCIEIERNGVTLIGGTMNSQASGLLVESFVSLHNVTDCSVVDVKMLNNNAQANYVVLAFCTNRLTVQRCRSLSGWALVDGNFMRNTIVTDSYGATIGCHAMAWNFTVERCTLAPTVVAGKYQGGVSVTGGGMLRVTDLTYTYMGGDRSIDHPVSTRGDYGQSWEGDVLIERVTLRVGAVPASGQGIAVFYANGADLGAIDLTRDCYLGGKRLEIRETRVQITSAAWAAADLVISPMWTQTTFTQNVRYPSDYIVDGWVVEAPGPGYTLDPRWVVLVTNTNAVPGITRNVFRDIQWPSTSVGFIGPAASTVYRVTPEITIEDSRSGFYISQLALPAGGRFTIRRSTIINMVLGNPNGSGEYFIEHCFINGTNAGGSPASADKAYYYQNHITTTNTVTVGSIAKYCHGNTVVSSGSISGRTVDEWYSYRDSTTFRTT